MNRKIQSIVKKEAQRVGLPFGVVTAIIKVESSNNRFAMRYEPNYKWLYHPEDFSGTLQTKDTEIIAQKTSWGLMQVMGAVARERGFDNTFLSELTDPQLGVRYGCKQLAHLWSRYDDLTDCIAAYNAGSPRKDDDGNYINQSYVDKVLKNWS